METYEKDASTKLEELPKDKVHTEKRLVVASRGWVWVGEMGESG